MARQPYYDVERGRMINGGMPIPFQDFDFDSQDFYDAIETLAKNGAEDNEIAVGLRHILPELQGLTTDQFEAMKNGRYKAWDEVERAERSAKIIRCLDCARTDSNRIIKGVYLSTALGRHKVKTVTTVTRRLRVDGQLTDNEEIQTTEVTADVRPDMQALGLWLHYHDPMWRKRASGELDKDSENYVPQGDKVKKGVSIASWLDREMSEFGSSDSGEVENGTIDEK